MDSTKAFIFDTDIHWSALGAYTPMANASLYYDIFLNVTFLNDTASYKMSKTDPENVFPFGTAQITVFVVVFNFKGIYFAICCA